MNQELNFIYAILLFLLLPFQNLFAQDNLQVEYANPTSVPNFLNICGEPDTATVTISLNGLSPDARVDIDATLELFEGVELVEFISAQSSGGITLDNNTNPNAPIFGLPDLSPSGITSVNLTFSIAAKCEYIDTLNANNAIQVQNNWKFNYTMGGSSLEENDLNTEYRDAFAVPSFTTVVNNLHGPARAGDCFSRDVVVTNSGLDGFVNQLNYSNTQGRGVYVESIDVNGVNIPITKTFLVTGDTLIEAVIDGTYFVGNTIGGGAGDGDGFLDPNETVTITENICVLNCFNSRSSVHDIEWGCEGRFCNTITTSDFVAIGQGAANVQVEDSGSIPNVYAGYCQDGVTTVTFRNNGIEVDPGFGAMLNLETGIGMGTPFVLEANGYSITQLTIAGVVMPTLDSLVLLDNNPLFAIDPDGVGGLEDLDGDGFFDDLDVGEEFEVTAHYEIDCSRTELPGDDGKCFNNLGEFFSARVDYDNACQDRIPRLQGNYFSPSNRNSDVETESTPDAFVEQDTFYINQSIQRVVGRFEKNCGGDEEFQVSIALPTGVSPVISTFVLRRNGGSVPIPLLSNMISNDTLFLVFDAAFSPFLIGNYDLNMGFTADCSATLDFVELPFEFAYYCPPCDCRHIWYCDVLEGPKLHAEEPPCPPNTFVCPTGLATKSFDVNRTTFGFTDATYSTPFDKDMANKKVAISCDSVQMKIVNVVGDTPITDSIGMVITYINPNLEADSIQTFLFDAGVVRFTNGGNEFFCNVDQSVLTTHTVDSIQFQTYDLHDCLTGLGLTLLPNDTIEFIGNFSVNPDGPYLGAFTNVPSFRAYGYGEIDGVQEACDNFGEIFTIAKNQTVVNFPSNSAFPEGCDEAVLDYNLLTVNNGFVEFFGNEYRQAIGIDSIVIDYDPMVLESFSNIVSEISIPGHPVFGNSYFSVQGLDVSDNGRYVAIFDTLQSVPALNNVTSYSFSFRIRMTPTCRSENGSVDSDNSYNFDPQIFFQDRYYATVIGDGSCATQRSESENNDIFYSEPPMLAMSTNSNPNFNLAGDTAYWDLQVCNTSFVGRAGLTWFALEDPTEAIEVVSMTDITDPNNFIDLTVESYGAVGSNYYAYMNPLEVGNALATFDDICNVIRVKALVNECGSTDFNTRAGWNCIAYTAPDWNPELYPPCDDVSQLLNVTTLDPALDANIIEQPTVDPNICDTNTIAILIRNTDLGTAFDLRTQIILPMMGASIVPGSVELAYPSGAAYQPVAVDPVFTTTTTRGDVYEYSDFSNLNTYLDQNGLPGFDPLNPTDSNEMVIRYKFVTDCNFMSGSISYYAIQGLKNCGDSTNYESGETLPIDINGADAGLNKIFDIKFSDQSVLIPNSTSTLQITATNLTTTATDNTDLVSLQLPEGVTYNANTTVAILPGGWVLDEPEIEVAGNFQQLFWNLPIGLLQGDSAVFSIEVTTPDLDCDVNSLEAGLNTVQRKELTCAAIAANCDVDVFTSINDGALTDLPVRQNTLSFNFLNINSTCTGVDEETISFNAAIQNNGTAFPATAFDVEYYFDADNSGNVNTGDPLLATFSESGPIAANASLNISHNIPASNNQVCNIIVRIDSTGLGICEIAEAELGEPQLINAGADQVFCEVNPTTISANLGEPSCGSISGYTFNWLAISPASTSDLSATDIPDPILTINHNAAVQDTLQYILETTRPSCGSTTRDTVNVIRALGLTINAGPTVFVQPGGSTTLTPAVTGGDMPYTYSWSPAATLDDPTSAAPIASPMVDTDYTVTVTSASGCSAEATLDVNTTGAVTINIEPYDTIVCAENTVPIIATGGTSYTWSDYPTNPTTGNLSAYNIPNPIFSNGLPDTTYLYKIIIEDLAFPGFFDSADVVIQTLPSPNVQIISSTTSFLCGGDEITLTASGAQSYVWENIGTQNQIGIDSSITVQPIAATTYQVTGTDTSGCISTEDITINVNQGAMAEIFTIPNTGCNGDSILLVGGTGTLVEWFENGASVGTGDSIYVSPIITSEYMLVVQDSVGCADTTTATIEIFDCPCAPIDIASIVTLETTCGNATGEATINLVDLPDDYTFAWSPDIGTSLGAGNIRTNLPFGGYEITIQSNTNSTCSEVVHLIIQNSDGPDATSTTTPATCQLADGTATLMPDTLNYLWEDNSTDVVRNDLTAGVHFVTLTDPADPNCPNVMMVEVDATNPLSATLTVIQAPDCGVANGSATIDVFGGSGNYTYSWDTGTATGTNLSSGFYSVTITDTDSSGCELVYEFVITDNVPPADVVVTATDSTSCTGAANGAVTFNINFDNAFQMPADTTITNGFEDFENGNLPNGDYCIIITDASDCVAGQACFTIESVDALEMNINVIPDCNMGGAVELQVLGGTPPYIFDWADLPGNDDPQNRDSLSAGVYDLMMIDSFGCAINHSVVILPCDTIMSSTFCDTIFIGQTEVFDIDISELPGSVVSLENVCLDASGTEVEFFEDYITLTVEYTGLEIGQDSACIVACDDLGFCDTTYLCMTVIEYLGPPILEDDCTDSVDIGFPIVMNVQENDLIYGGLDSMYIDEQPLYGEATLNLDGSITYNAGDVFCERLDSFTYVICNPNMCDTATVCLFINCTDIVIFNAVSPNGDGVNDAFYIAGIEDYPNSILKIYNRWGNMVYERIGYKNNWEGTFNGKRELPDGTYFYILELNDKDDDRVFQGSLEIYR